QGNWVLRNKNFSYLNSSVSSEKAAASNQVSSSAPHQSLCDYLGEPVQVPDNLDSAYTPQALANTARTAAQLAGISINVEVDDSEFPCLLGITCQESDFSKLTQQLRKMEAYDYTGSV